MKRIALAVWIPIVAPFCAEPAAAAVRHEFRPIDWQNLRSATPRAIAPNGRTILYETTHGRRTGGDVHE